MAEKYTVTGQRQTTTMINGSFVPAVEVTFKTTGSENIQSVLVPLSSYSAEHVKAAIEARVETIDAINEL